MSILLCQNTCHSVDARTVTRPNDYLFYLIFYYTVIYFVAVNSLNVATVIVINT